jgi:hypothetical protein
MTTDRFDEAIRAAHAQSLDHLSPRVRAQLQQRRRAALSGESLAPARPWRFAVPLAAAFAVGAIVIGLQPREPAPAQVVATVQPTPAQPAAITQTEESVEYATLEESPEMYAWLASDGAALAMESPR